MTDRPSLLLEAHSKAQQKTIELLRVELASAKECWAEALENVATRNREIERLRGQLNFANREPPHCPSCNCGALEPNPHQPTACTHAKMRCERCGDIFSRQDGVQ